MRDRRLLARSRPDWVRRRPSGCLAFRSLDGSNASRHAPEELAASRFARAAMVRSGTRASSRRGCSTTWGRDSRRFEGVQPLLRGPVVHRTFAPSSAFGSRRDAVPDQFGGQEIGISAADGHRRQPGVERQMAFDATREKPTIAFQRAAMGRRQLHAPGGGKPAPERVRDDALADGRDLAHRSTKCIPGRGVGWRAAGRV